MDALGERGRVELEEARGLCAGEAHRPHGAELGGDGGVHVAEEQRRVERHDGADLRAGEALRAEKGERGVGPVRGSEVREPRGRLAALACGTPQVETR